MALRVEKLGPDSLERAADVLVRAFFDYPLWTWLLPDEAVRRECCRSRRG